MADENMEIDALVANAKSRVQAFLARNWKTELTEWGWRCPFESTVVYVEVRPHQNQKNTIVEAFAPVLWEVPYSEELLKYVAFFGGTRTFGHLELREDEKPGLVNLMFAHTLLADYLDEEELNYLIGAIGSTADDLDDELKSKFGGKRQADLS